MDTYEKKYKEALELARVAAFNGHQSLMEGIFPELAESEDEKIREYLIRYIDNTMKSSELKSKLLAWLEKQKGCEYIKKDWLEHIKQSWYKEGFIDGKYTPKELTINDAATLNELIDFLENGTVKLQHDLTLYANWLKTQFPPNEKQGEQKPQRMISAEAKEALYDKPDWSEKDENVLEDIEEAIINYWHGDTQDILLDWLKSIKQRIEG